MLLTPEDQAAWNDILARYEMAVEAKNKIDDERAVFASKFFAQLLATGKWEVYCDDYMRPANSKASAAIIKFIQIALGLNYHDEFTIQNEDVSIYGRLDDGELTVNIYALGTHGSNEYDVFDRGCRTLNIDIDLKSWIREQQQESLAHAREQVAKAQARLAELEAKQLP